MFGPVPDRGHDNSAVSVPVLIPWLFVWRYGGRSVSLCGSFNRWSGSIPMSPVEGRDDVFQVVCNLTPGSHQYKFCVDGVLRHDESQPFSRGDYGLVNTIFVGREPDMINSTFGSQTPGRSNMDVDHDDIMPAVSLSHGTSQEAIPRISSADLEVSRHHISVFLSTHTAYELLPDSGKIITLDINLPVKQAFHILHEQGISVAPLWDCGQFVGVLSALDFILILRELGNHGSNMTEEQLETHTIAAWKEGKLHLTRTMDGDGGSFPRQHLIHAGPYDCMKDVALKILQNKVATVPIIHHSQDGSIPQLLHLASLSGILKCIYRYFRHSLSSLPILEQPICSIPLGTWVPKIGESRPFAMLRPNASLSAALTLLVQAEVSSIPIVDDNGSLLDIYSRSDITSLAKDKAYAQIRLDEMTIHQALRLGQNANSSYGFNGQRFQMCLRSDPLHEVMKRLTIPGVRRLVIVEAGSNRVEGVISLSDVFNFLLR
ncbi:sucrose nonfermenting 4-like protein isoform X1 [Juglans microcarpa x Juglans regia]|uniref:sucrose nonfermenting 4-like protein isoform X1 n=1 Tax=Juglans microcarpa x Juglans regia TaxID=2249226 RepID=UPI001B7ED709|nr:sucrose nonfermenting 4-like protein isoform X1 [Juglans microcarpa x Juglans regia]